MLSSISWEQFWIFTGIGLVVYYGYILAVYYRKEGLASLRAKGRSAEEDLTDEPAGEMKTDRSDQAAPLIIDEPLQPLLPVIDDVAIPELAPEDEGHLVAPMPQQGLLFDGEAMQTETQQQGPVMEQYRAMEDAVRLLGEKIREAAAVRMQRSELETAIQQILAGYRFLRGSGCEVSINNFLIRSCGIPFGMKLSKEDLLRLWGG